MAMRKRNRILVASSAFVLLILVLWIYFAYRTPSVDDSLIASDSSIKAMSKDTKTAQKELRAARKALDKYKPTGLYIVINTHSNKVSLCSGDSVLYEGICSTGTGGELVDSLTGRRWVFDTPRGVFKVNSKLKEPWWRKPDWAYLEEDEKIPKDERERYDPEMLGAFALGFGDGYFIHGTIYERLLGISVTHGCVRLGSDDLKYIYDRVKIGTPVYVL